MGVLQVLPARIANMIAAGEVVQRPSSVIKELVENAVDAGADKIDVIVSDAGRTLIQVIDNGCGMSPAEAVLCFERHATSKIAEASDLESILSYGFRGEALASIAAVSEVTLKTRREQDAAATQVHIADGKIRSSEVSAAKGSNFAIRNLFYNTPARRKFLKSDSVEMRHIVDEFAHIAIPHPEIEFSLTHNGKEIFVLRKEKSLKMRVKDVFGLNVAETLMDIDTATEDIKVSGFVGTPESARKTVGNQLFFVRGRFFRSAYLHKAVMKAYEEMLPNGLTPVYMIFLDVDPSEIDVNISPTKSEVKFENDSIVFQIVYASVKATLGKNSLAATIDFDSGEAVQMPLIGKGFEAFRNANPLDLPAGDPSYNPFNSGSYSPSFGDSAAEKLPFSTAVPVESDGGASKPQRYYSLDREKIQNCSALFDSLPSANAIVLQKRFLLTPVSSGLMVINIKRAAERILYERSLQSLSGLVHISQTALFPVTLEIGVTQRLVIEENLDLLRKLGYSISLRGNDSIVLEGVPEGCNCSEGALREIFDEICDILSEPNVNLTELVNQKYAARFAAVAASRFSIGADSAAYRHFIDTLFACDNAELTPGGRKTLTIIETEDIEKRF